MNNNDKLKKIIEILEVVVQCLFNEKKNKFNIYWTCELKEKPILFQIKEKQLPHILGIHYWKLLDSNINKRKNDVVYMKYFFRKVITGQLSYNKLRTLLEQNYSKLSKDITKTYKVTVFFNFLIKRLCLFLAFVLDIQSNKIVNASLYSNNNTDFRICYFPYWTKNKNNKNNDPYFELCDITHPRYNYETYYIKSIKVIRMNKKGMTHYPLKIRNITTKLNLKNIYDKNLYKFILDFIK